MPDHRATRENRRVSSLVVHRARRWLRPRARLSLGVDRVRGRWWAIGQSAVAAMVAWETAVHLLGHSAPFFASVAGIVCLGVTVTNRLRRVLEMGIGVSIGVGLGDLLLGLTGRGGWQMGLVVVCALSVAVLLDGGNLIANQAGLQAVFVVALPEPDGGYLGRWEDALLGASVAVLIAFLAPGDPRPGARRAVRELVAVLSASLVECSAAARAGNPAASATALELVRGTQRRIDGWVAAVKAGEEISRLTPLRDRAQAEIAEHRRCVVPLDRAVRNLRVAVRRMVAVVEDGGGEVPAPVLDLFDELAAALHTLPGTLMEPDGEGRRRALAAFTRFAARLDARELGATTMAATVVVAQMRSAVIDLLQVAGTDRDAARAALPGGPHPQPTVATPEPSAAVTGENPVQGAGGAGGRLPA